MASTTTQRLLIFLFMFLIAVASPVFIDDIGIEGSFTNDIDDMYPSDNDWSVNGSLTNTTSNNNGQLVIQSSELPGTGTFTGNVQTFEVDGGVLDGITLDKVGYSAENLVLTQANTRTINITVEGLSNGTVTRSQTIEATNGADTVNLSDEFDPLPRYDRYRVVVDMESDYADESPELNSIEITGTAEYTTGRELINGWQSLIQLLLFALAILAAVKLAVEQ